MTKSIKNAVGIGGIITSALSSIGGLVYNGLNFKAQQENLAYQRQLQNRIFAREDTAVQRKVADLKAAGLSPSLAAGSGASSGGVVSTSAPQFQQSGLNEITSALFDILREERESKIAEKQLEGMDAENRVKEAEATKAEALLKTELDYQSVISEYNAKKNKWAQRFALDPTNEYTAYLYNQQNAHKLLRDHPELFEEGPFVKNSKGELVPIGKSAFTRESFKTALLGYAFRQPEPTYLQGWIDTLFKAVGGFLPFAPMFKGVVK